MSELWKQEQAAIAAVARHVSATWEHGADPPGATIAIGGKRIAVEVTNLTHKAAGGPGAAKPGLRFDKVARRLIARLQDALSQSVPAGMAVMVAVTAPIRLPAKTAEAAEEKIRGCLARWPATTGFRESIRGNHVRVRLVPGIARPGSSVIGFVHNPDADADVILGVVESLLRHVGAAADRRAPAGSAAERWLAVVIADAFSHGETYRQVYAALSIATDFVRILMVFPDGRVETLR